FTLSFAGGTVTGTSVLGSCILTVTASAYTAGTGPQVHDVMALSPCEFDSTDNTLSVTNGTITATSIPPAPPGTSSSNPYPFTGVAARSCSNFSFSFLTSASYDS